MSGPNLWATGLRLPTAWVCRSEAGQPGQGLALVAAPAHVGPPGSVPPCLVVRLTPTRATERAWLTALPAELVGRPGFEVEDEDLIDLGMQDVGYLRYSHRGLGDPPDDLLSERWSWWHDGFGLTVTGTVSRQDYEVWCDLFETVAATVDATRLTGAA